MLAFDADEKVIYENTPSQRILTVWFFNSFFTLSVFAFFIPVWLMDGKMQFKHPLQLFFLQVLLAILIFVMAYMIFLRKTYHYYITNERIIFTGGILLKRTRSVPFHKVNDILTSRNIVEQGVGLGTLSIFTASTSGNYSGSKRPEIQFSGLLDTEKPRKIIMEHMLMKRRGKT